MESTSSSVSSTKFVSVMQASPPSRPVTALALMSIPDGAGISVRVRWGKPSSVWRTGRRRDRAKGRGL